MVFNAIFQLYRGGVSSNSSYVLFTVINTYFAIWHQKAVISLKRRLSFCSSHYLHNKKHPSRNTKPVKCHIEKYAKLVWPSYYLAYPSCKLSWTCIATCAQELLAWVQYWCFGANEFCTGVHELQSCSRKGLFMLIYCDKANIMGCRIEFVLRLIKDNMSAEWYDRCQ
jgi:hypothetical protein